MARDRRPLSSPSPVEPLLVIPAFVRTREGGSSTVIPMSIVDPTWHEQALLKQGFRSIAGVDETGRGALAGPLVAAAVILPHGFNLVGIDDSKRLTRRQRQLAFERIVAAAVFTVCWAEPNTINRDGLDVCNVRLLRRAAHRLRPEPDYVLVDGSVAIPSIRFPSQTIEKGDALSVSIAAASIVAKVTRDRLMDRLHGRYPSFGFDHNRGYGSADHLEALTRLGPSPANRRTRRTRGIPK
jgi:ribonuclease HII